MESSDSGWTPAPGEVVTVSELLRSARNCLESGFCDVWVEGEVVDLKIPASGHAYFSVGDESCRMKAVCFRSALRLIRPPLSEGLSMLFRGRLSVFEQRGDLQFVVEYAEPRGEGLLRLKLEELKKKLAAEGLFSEERKRPLPPMPRAVGVVTSATGAAVRDVIKVLGRRAPWVEVIVSPARVQGEGAAAEIRAALKLLLQVERVDLVIVGRGGGSSDDLSAFNDEALVRAVAAFPKPVISAVGHEVDFTLTDFVADRRAPTPSAAAEMAVVESSHLLSNLRRGEAALLHALEGAVLKGRARLNRADPSRVHPLRRLEQSRMVVDRLGEALAAGVAELKARADRRLALAQGRLGGHAPTAELARARGRLEKLSGALEGLVQGRVGTLANRVRVADSALGGLNPLAILARGYAVARDRRGRILKSTAGVKLGDEVNVTLSDGTLTSEVREIIGKGVP